MNTQTGIMNRVLAPPLVSLYMAGVLGYLLVTKKVVPPTPLWKVIRSWFTPLFRGELTDFRQESGYCWVALLPVDLLSDKGAISKLVVLENGVPLSQGHAAHNDIRMIGNGLYSHWGTEVYFSTSDNSDPRSNGRRYTVEERREP